MLSASQKMRRACCRVPKRQVETAAHVESAAVLDCSGTWLVVLASTCQIFENSSQDANVAFRDAGKADPDKRADVKLLSPYPGVSIPCCVEFQMTGKVGICANSN